MSFLTAWIKREQGLAKVEVRLGNDTSNGKPAKTVAPPGYERFLEPNPCTTFVSTLRNSRDV
jgi:hypothetical protein